MTVLFACVSKTNRFSFLGSDDLEYISGARRDKLNVSLGRYAMGVVGNNVLADVAPWVGIFPAETVLRSGSVYSVPDSVEAVLGVIEELLPQVVHSRFAFANDARNSGGYTDEQWDILCSQGGTLVVVDIEKYRLVSAEFGQIFPPKPRYRVLSTRDYANDLVIRFGINDPTSLGAIGRDAMKCPFRWAKERVAEARDLLVNAGHVVTIGELGACVYAKNGKVRYRAPFDSLSEALRQCYP